MWVADWARDKLYAYNMVTKARDEAKDFNTLETVHIEGNRPHGIWPDGTTMWISKQFGNTRLYGYNVAPGTRKPRIIDTSSRIGTTTRLRGGEEPEPPPPSAVKAHCITEAATEEVNSGAGHIELGTSIEDQWSGDCPSVTRGGRMAKYYTFSIPHTTAVVITLVSTLDNYLVLRSNDLSGPVVARDDDSFILLNAKIAETLPARDYVIEATTFGMEGVEQEFLLSAQAVERVLYRGPASEIATTGYAPMDTYLSISLLPTLPLPTMQIMLRDEDGFGPGQPGAAEQLLQGRIETDAGSPGSVMLAVPHDVWVGYGDIMVETSTSAFGDSWDEHTVADEQEILDNQSGGGFFGFLKRIASAATSIIGGNNPLATIAGWLDAVSGGQTYIGGRDAAMLGLGASPVSSIFQAGHSNCFSQVSVPWLIEEEGVKRVRITVPVILTDDEYVSVGAEFISREDGDNEQSLVQAHDLLDTGQDLPACQGP